MKSSRVFVVQTPQRGIDLATAAQFGRLVGPLLSNEPQLGLSLGVADMLRTLGFGLSTYTSDDYLLLLGNPIGMGVAVHAAAMASPNGLVSFLKWHRNARCYEPVTIDLRSLRPAAKPARPGYDPSAGQEG